MSCRNVALGLQWASRREGRDELGAAAGLRASNTTISRSKEDGSAASAELRVGVAKVAAKRVRVSHCSTQARATTYFAREREMVFSFWP